MIWILDRQRQVAAVLDNRAQGLCPFFDDGFVERVDGLMTFEFSIPLDHADAAHVAEEAYVAIADSDGTMRLLRIKTADEVTDSRGQRVKRVSAENAALELLYSVIGPANWPSVTPETALTSILTGTRWSPGIVESGTVRHLAWGWHMTRLGAVRELVKLWGVEPRYRIELGTGGITGQFVDLLIRRGEDRGKLFSYSKDTKAITRTIDTSELYTSMVGLGSADRDGRALTFAGVAWARASGHPADKPLGQDWVGDDDARSLWGLPHGADTIHLTGTHQDPDQANAAQLLADTWDVLQRAKRPKITYSIDVALLDQLPRQSPLEEAPEHEAVGLGDDVTVTDFTFDPPLAVEARVIEMSLSMSEPSKNRVKLGDFRTLVVDSVDPRAIERRVYAGEGLYKRDTVSGTVTIATFDSLHPQRADFRCDGSHDQVEIQQAIDSLAGGGGTVLLLDGNYILGENLVLRPGVFVRGQGQSSVMHTNGCSIGPAVGSSSDIRWSDMSVSSGVGLLAAIDIHSCTGGFIDNVHFTGAQTPVRLRATRGDVIIRNCRFTNILHQAVWVDGWHSSAGTFPGSLQITGSVFERCDCGVRLEAARHTRITDCYFRLCGDGAHDVYDAGVHIGAQGLLQTGDITVQGCTFEPAANALYTVYIGGAPPRFRDITVTGNRFVDGGSGAAGGWGRRTFQEGVGWR